MTQSLKLSFCNARHGLRKVVGEVCQLLYHFFYFPPFLLLPLAGNFKNEMKYSNMEQVSHIEKRKNKHTISWCQEPLLEEARLEIAWTSNGQRVQCTKHFWNAYLRAFHWFAMIYTQHVWNLHSSCVVAHATPPSLVSLKSGTWMSTLLPLRSRILPVRVPKPGNQKCSNGLGMGIPPFEGPWTFAQCWGYAGFLMNTRLQYA